MKQLSLLAAPIVAPVIHYLECNGASVEPYLDRVRIPGEVISSGGWVAKKQVYDLLHDVAQRERCPHVIFSAFAGFEIENLGPIGVAMSSAKTVKDALRILTRLAGLAYEGNTYFLRSEGNTTWLCCRESERVSEGDVFAQQATLAIFLKIIRLAVDSDWRPGRISTQSQMQDSFQMPVDWEDCRSTMDLDLTGLAFPTEFLARRYHGHQEVNSDSISDGDWVPEVLFENAFVDSLHRLIASQFLFKKLPSLNEVAAIVNVSTRTIKRRLAAEGLSFRHLLDRICYDAAVEMLAVQRMTVTQTANELGYANTSKFVRSFRRMTGMTPGAFCRQRFGQP